MSSQNNEQIEHGEKEDDEGECKSPESAAALTKAHSEQFNLRKKLLEEGSARRTAMALILQKLTKGDDELEQALETAQQKALALARAPLPKPLPTPTPSNADFGLLTPSFVPPWEFLWDFEDHVGTGFFQTHKSAGGVIGFNLHANDGAGSCAVAVGTSFKAPHPGLTSMRLSAHLGISLSYGNTAPFGSGHTSAYIGLFVREFTPSATVGGDVIDQKISLWYLDSDDDFSQRESFPLSASFPINDGNRYEIWVRCGGEVASSGTSYANLTVNVALVSGFLG